MRIETKFEVEKKVVTINDGKIVTLPVQSIGINCTPNYNSIRYTLLISKGVSLVDKDSTVVKDEDECFESIDKLAEYYKSKQNT